MNNIIFVFPGQGAQYVGMGKDVFEDFAVARYTFQEVSDLSKKNIKNICFNSKSDVLNDPENVSLATFAHSIAISRVIESEFGKNLFDISYAMAGHSMGQYSALCMAQSISVKDSINILCSRSKHMSLSNVSGGMVCVIGLNKAEVNKIISSVKNIGFAEISNHNAIDQFVISGDNNVLDTIVMVAKKNGAQFARRLNVSIPAHCKIMAPAESFVRKDLVKINVGTPKTKWFSNHNADVVESPNDIKESLASQITNGVRWFDTMLKFKEHKISHAYELGPGKVLSKLINNSIPGNISKCVGTSICVKKMIDELGRSI